MPALANTLTPTVVRQSDTVDWEKCDLMDLLLYYSLEDFEKDMVNYIHYFEKLTDLPRDGLDDIYTHSRERETWNADGGYAYLTWRGWLSTWVKGGRDWKHPAPKSYDNYRHKAQTWREAQLTGTTR